jgi:nucleoside-diphosphate-sugar epimerase
LRNQRSAALLVNVSSVSVYGPSEDVLDESAPCRPRSYYGETKLAGEREVLEATAAGGVRGVVLRPCMVFGPAAPGNLARVVALARWGLLIQIGDGRNRKSLLPVQTLVEAILRVADRRSAAVGRVFNVCGGPPLTIQEIGLELAQGLGSTPRVVSVPRRPLVWLAHVADSVFERLPFSVANLAQLVEAYASTSTYSDERFRSHFAFDPRVDVRTALRSMAAVYRHSPS